MYKSVGTSVILFLFFFALSRTAVCFGLSSADTSAIRDSDTGISFTTPPGFKVIHGHSWPCVPPEGVDKDMKSICWNVYNSVYDTGTIKERSIDFSSSLAASDGPEGGTAANIKYLKTVKSVSQDEVLIFELSIYGHGNAADMDGRRAGYLLAVDLKKPDPKNYSELFISSPTIDVAMKVAKSISIPEELSTHNKKVEPDMTDSEN